MRKTFEIVAFSAGIGLLGACGTPEPAGPRDGADDPAAARTEALDSIVSQPVVSQPVAPTPSAPQPAAPHAEQHEVVLDQRADGARLLGRVEPVLPNADPERVMVLGVRAVEPSIAAALEGARVLEARFVDDSIVTVGADHVLRHHSRSGVTELDTHAYGPLSVAGTELAYVRGEAPLLELARADVASGTASVLTQNMAPVWSPALTPDGRAIVFVSGAQGTPRLYRIDGSGTPRALPQLERFPSSPVAPRFEGELFVFEDHLGTAWVDLEQGRIVRTAGVQ